MKAILRPSGDQRPRLSWAPEVRVRLRVGPFSTGTLKTSPRAVNTARSPLGREGEVLDVAGGGDLGGPAVHGVVGTCDRQMAVLAGPGVVDVAARRSSRRRSGRPVSALGQRTSHCVLFVSWRRGAGRHVVGVKVERAGAVRVEIDLVADPHGIALGQGGVGDLLGLVAREVEDPEVLGPAALDSASRCGSRGRRGCRRPSCRPARGRHRRRSGMGRGSPRPPSTGTV